MFTIIFEAFFFLKLGPFDGSSFLISCQCCTYVLMRNLKFKSSMVFELSKRSSRFDTWFQFRLPLMKPAKQIQSNWPQAPSCTHQEARMDLMFWKAPNIYEGKETSTLKVNFFLLWRSVNFRMNLWSHRLSQNMN